MQPHNSSTTPRKHDDSTSAALHETAAALRTLDLAVSTSNGGPGLHLLKCGGRTKRVHPETGKTSWKWDAKKPSETGWQKKRPKIDAVDPAPGRSGRGEAPQHWHRFRSRPGWWRWTVIGTTR